MPKRKEKGGIQFKTGTTQVLFVGEHAKSFIGQENMEDVIAWIRTLVAMEAL